MVTLNSFLAGVLTTLFAASIVFNVLIIVIAKNNRRK